jgi:hypothetical protein
MVDLATGRIKCYHQTSLNAHETITSKCKYEQEARQYGVKVMHYHCDNGTFTARNFVNEVWERGQSISFSGVGAKFQNAVAESAVRTVTYMARTMMLHAALRWPEAYSADLWPFAMSYACHVYNNLPRRETGMSPEEAYVRDKLDTEDILRSLLPWGCPAYVLQHQLQDDNSLPKWKPRSRRGQFLGVSEFHCQKSVHLVRNLYTQRVSPQFHTVMDPQFSTVYADSDEPPPEWEDLLIYSQYQADMDLEIDGVPPELHPEWTVDRDNPTGRHGREEGERRRVQAQTPTPRLPDPAPTQLMQPYAGERHPSNLKRGSKKAPANPSPAPDVLTPPESIRPEIPKAEEAPSRPKRESKPVDRLTYTDRGESVWQSNLTELVSLLAEPRPAGAPMFDPIYLATSLFHDPEEGTVEDFLPGVYDAPWSLTAKKGKNDPDYPTYAEAMSGPYRDKFIEGMQKEIAELASKDTWVKVDRSSVPKGTQIIRTTWAFRIARLPSGEIKKWKSCYVIRDDTQGSNVTMDCFSPTMSWSTV